MSDELKQLFEAWMNEVTAVLCYQSDILHEHKMAIAEALNRYLKLSNSVTSTPKDK